jgi:ABC-2 type transport system ATP-binding protein
MNTVPVEVQGLERSHGLRPVLRGVDLDVFAGDIIGVVGPNGSGKTTLLKVIGGFLRPMAGEVRVFGRRPFDDRASIMEHARFAFSPPALFDELTAFEHLRYLGTIGRRGMPRVTGKDVEGILELVGLAERAHERVEIFTPGMRQRLVLAIAMLPTPELLVLDEPTLGLDPHAALGFRSLLRRLRDEHGTAILFTSHQLAEVVELTDRLLVLHDGRSRFYGKPSGLVGGGKRLRLGVDDPERARTILTERGIEIDRIDGEGLDLAEGAISLIEATAALSRGGVTLRSYSEHRPTLERGLLDRMRVEVLPAAENAAENAEGNAAGADAAEEGAEEVES